MSMSLTAPTASLRRTTVVAGLCGASATVAAAAALRGAGVRLAAGGSIPLAAFAQFAFVGAILGGVLVAVLNRRSTMPRRHFVQTVLVLTAVSCVAPVAFGDGVASALGLIATHLVAAAIIVPVLARQSAD